MRRIGLFFGVFSVGLVLFMALTGQLGRYLREDEDPFAEDPWKRDRPEENFFTYHCPDAQKGRDRFTIRGIIDSSAPLKITDTQIQRRSTLRDAVLDLPLYTSPGDPRQHSPESFRLTAARVTYDPGRRSVRMEGGITGTGDNGSRFETSTLEVKWTDDRDDVEIESSEPLTLEYPSIELFGEAGFVGQINDRIGLRSLVIHPPVVLAVERESGTGFLGLSSAPRSGSETAGEGVERIFLVGDGPLVISRLPDKKGATARFQNKVAVFNAPASTPLHPRPAVPQEFFECDDLELTLDPVNMQLLGAHARGRETPVRAHFKVGSEQHPYRLSGGTLDWDVKSAEARLAGPDGISIEGHVGQIQARRARLRPQERLCLLEDQVSATVEAAHLVGVGAPDDRRLQNRWRVRADRATVSFSTGSRSAQKFELLAATSKEPNGVILIEDFEDGARLRGSVLRYDAKAKTLVVEGAGTGARPYFSDGPSQVVADRLVLDIDRAQLRFGGSVESRLHGVEGVELPAALQKRQDEGHAEIECEELTLEWRRDPDGTRNLSRVLARRGGSPLDFRTVGIRRYRLRGDDLTWSDTERLVTLSGPEVQHLFVDDDLELRARRIDFDLEASRASAAGGVWARAERSFLVDRTLRPEENRQVTLQCETLELELRPFGDEAATEATEDRPPIRSARARAAAGSQVEIDDGLLRARGQEFRWNAGTGALEIAGEGHQHVRYQSETGPDQLSAERIQLFNEGESARAVLTGSVLGHLHQRSSATSPISQTPLVWDLATERLEARFSMGSEGPDPTLDLETLTTEGGVRVESVATEDRERIVFAGSRCEWRRENQRLRLFSASGDELQSLRLGPAAARDEIVAREIVVGRDGKDLWVFFQDVLRATMHVDESARARRPEVPASFRFLRAILLVNLVAEGVPRTETPSDGEARIREAISWGSVNFKGGPTQIVADRAVYRSTDSSVTFHGRPGQPPRIVEGTQPFEPGDPLVIRKTGGVFRVDVSGRRGSLDVDEVISVLRRLDKRERSPR